MSLSIFGEKAFLPDNEAVAAALGPCKALWDAVKARAAAYEKPGEEWKYYSKKAGWSLLLKSGKRTLVYLIPQAGGFKMNVVFGERAVAAAREAQLPPAVLQRMEEAAPYMEGRSFMIDVKAEADQETAKQLMEIKYQN